MTHSDNTPTYFSFNPKYLTQSGWSILSEKKDNIQSQDIIEFRKEREGFLLTLLPDTGITKQRSGSQYFQIEFNPQWIRDHIPNHQNKIESLIDIRAAYTRNHQILCHSYSEAKRFEDLLFQNPKDKPFIRDYTGDDLQECLDLLKEKNFEAKILKKDKDNITFFLSKPLKERGCFDLYISLETQNQEKKLRFKSLYRTQRSSSWINLNSVEFTNLEKIYLHKREQHKTALSEEDIRLIVQQHNKITLSPKTITQHQINLIDVLEHEKPTKEIFKTKKHNLSKSLKRELFSEKE